MTAAGNKPISWVMLIHVFLTLGIGLWFGWWGYFHHPAIEWRAKAQAHAAATERRAPSKVKAPALDPTKIKLMDPANSTGKFSTAITAFGYAWVDAAFALCGLMFFYIGTGTYFKMVDNWIQARASGDVQAIRGRGLQAQALSENLNRGGQ